MTLAIFHIRAREMNIAKWNVSVCLSVNLAEGALLWNRLMMVPRYSLTYLRLK